MAYKDAVISSLLNGRISRSGIEATSKQIAEYLDVKKGEAILRMRQISFFDDGTPFEYVRSQYVGSRFEFYLEK